MKRRNNRVLEAEPALIMSATLAEMYTTFQKRFPLDKLSYTEFKLLKPWKLKKAFRETCLCRTCELFGMYREALHKVGTALEPLLAPGDGLEDQGADGDGDGDGSVTSDGVHAQGSGGGDSCTEVGGLEGGGPLDGGVGAEGGGGSGRGVEGRGSGARCGDPATANASHLPALQALADFCWLECKGELAQALVCGGCIETAQPMCLSGKCVNCGFSKLWQPVCEKLVDGGGKLRDGIDAVWQSTLRYEVLKSGKKTPSDGSNTESNDTLRESKESSIIEFLDKFDEVCASTLHACMPVLSPLALLTYSPLAPSA
jgi:hypothetical protein